MPLSERDMMQPASRKPPTARLRTKTGCFKCRERRKKCDEVRPICSGCSRNCLLCTWPDLRPPSSWSLTKVTSPSSTGSKNLHSIASVNRQFLSPKIVFSDPTIETLQSPLNRSLFDHFRFVLWPLLLRSDAHPIYLSCDWFLRGAVQNMTLMHGLLACSAVHMSHLYPKYRLTAIEYYSRAVSATREKIEEKEVDGTEDWLVMFVVVSFLFELWLFDDLRSVKNHLEAAAQLLQSRQLSFQRRDLIPDPLFERLISESIIYNTSTIVALVPEGCSVPLSGLTGGSSDPPSGNKPHESPLLGVSPELYYFVVEVSRLGLESPSNNDREPENVRALASKYILWKRSSMLELGGSQSGLEAKFMLGIQLYVIAIDLVFCTIGIGPGCQEAERSMHASILVTQGVHIIKQIGPYIESALNMSYYAWPLAVIGSAGTGREDCVGTIRNKLDDILEKTGSRGVEMVKGLLENVWVSEEELGLEKLLCLLRNRNC